MIDIERLRALERDIRSSGGPGCQYHADQIAALIAEIGQEVGAVGYDDGTGRVRDWASPAHTLEARDAARYRWIREKTTHEDWDGYSLPHVCDINFKPGSQLNEMHETLDAAIDAAMRQEGGNG